MVSRTLSAENEIKMELIDRIEKIRFPYDNAVVTIGNFDGMHIGHQALFKEVIQKAKEIDGTSVAMTFEPHPIRVLKQNGQPPLITLYEQKLELIDQTGIDVLICIPFTSEFAAISAKAFVEDLLVRRIGMKAMVVGKDYTYGKNREGTLDTLKADGQRLGFEVIVAEWIRVPTSLAGRASSTLIRELIMDGQLKHARELLGRYYQIRGKVVTGRHRGGTLLGFPTANINIQDELCPKNGIYAVTVDWRGRCYKGVANIGFSPTFDDHRFTVEVHIIDFDQDIYGERIRVNFIEWIRDEVKFNDISELSEQIRRDIQTADRILSASCDSLSGSR
jgi:riboflavin kinase/FMN adenylyltransferase